MFMCARGVSNTEEQCGYQLGGHDANRGREGDASQLKEDILVGGNLHVTFGEFTEAGGRKEVGGLSLQVGGY